MKIRYLSEQLIFKDSPNLSGEEQSDLTSSLPVCQFDPDMRDNPYWDGLTQQEIIIYAVTELMANKNIKSRPETVKNRRRLGRKPKI